MKFIVKVLIAFAVLFTILSRKTKLNNLTSNKLKHHYKTIES